MPELQCENVIRNLLRTAINYPSHTDLVNYVNSPETIPSWDLLFLTIPALRKKYWQALVSLHRELVPNYISGQDIYTRLWELFKEVTVNANDYQTSVKLKNKLSEFCEAVKKPLQTYDIIYEIKYFDVGENKLEYGNVEIFKLTEQYLNEIGARIDISELKDEYKKWVGKTVAKTEVSVSDINRAFESGFNSVSRILETLRLTAVWGRISQLDDEMFLWELGSSITIPKVKPDKGTVLSESFHRGFRPFIIPMDKAIIKGLEDQKAWRHLLEGNFPEDIKTRIFKAIRWISNAVTSSGMDYKVVYLCTALEILLLPDHREGSKGELIALRQVLIGRGSSYVPEGILHQYERRSDIIHSGTLEITGYSSYWHLLICCLQVLSNLVNLSKRNPDIQKLVDLLKIVENVETLQHFIHNCELGIYNGEGINKIKKAAESRLKQVQGHN